MAATNSGWMRVSKEAASAAWAQLAGSDVHTHFLGYLAIREEARVAGKSNNLKVKFKGFFDRFLRPNGMTADVPYIKPFGGPTNAYNIAGSYAPSSLRGVAPLTKVATFAGGGAKTTFSLLPNHTDLAHTHLLHGKPISGLALSVFLYRDYLIQAPTATSSGLLQILEHDFALSAADMRLLLVAPFNFQGALF